MRSGVLASAAMLETSTASVNVAVDSTDAAIFTDIFWSNKKLATSWAIAPMTIASLGTLASWRLPMGGDRLIAKWLYHQRNKAKGIPLASWMFNLMQAR